jgi:[ribosomal protein S5]-alanine N-acetyltransferase
MLVDRQDWVDHARFQESRMIPILDTERLILRPLVLKDAAAAQELFPKWEIVRYLNDKIPWPYPDDGALSFYRDVALPAMERGESWTWAIRLKGGPGHMIGSIGLMKSDQDHRGFWLGLPWQRQGLMTEACRVVTEFWFNTLQFPVLRVPKAVDNLASRRISEKEGMRIVAIEDRDYVSGRWPTEIWELTREQWNARGQFRETGTANR